MEERRGEQQVAAQAGMELRRLAAEGRDADRVLEQAAGIAVVPVGAAAGSARNAARTASSAKTPVDDRREPGCVISAARNSRNPSSSSGVAPDRGCELGRVASGRSLERAHLELEPAAEPLHAPEHAHRVPFLEARVQQLHVVPDARLDPSARVDQLEREIRRAALRPPPLLARDRVTCPRRRGPRRARQSP